jgi:hypothetical protein
MDRIQRQAKLVQRIYPKNMSVLEIRLAENLRIYFHVTSYKCCKSTEQNIISLVYFQGLQDGQLPTDASLRTTGWETMSYHIAALYIIPSPTADFHLYQFCQPQYFVSYIRGF